MREQALSGSAEKTLAHQNSKHMIMYQLEVEQRDYGVRVENGKEQL